MKAARAQLRPTGFGDGVPLAGGPVRFAQFALTIGAASSVVPVDGLAAALAALPSASRAHIERLRDRILAPRPPVAGLDFGRPHVMGILNATPDSFSDGGDRRGDPAELARAMIAAGASIIDIGGESTRPRAPLVTLDEELARVGPLLDALRDDGPRLSIDTRKAGVMARALAAGVAMVNDVSALTHDPAALSLVAAAGCPVVLMHAQGTPQTMQDNPVYDDVVGDVFDWFDARIDACVAAGIARERIVVDPGIGFGKTLAHNLALLRDIAVFHGLGCPILLGVSRKYMIRQLADAAIGDRLPGSLALALHGVAHGVQIVRVHDVAATVQALRLWSAVAR
ncbi:MAG: dihydropteroate synthase [Janthinobacterium lividum]